jgi:rSAM/selenodomain-associated transferase 1
VLSGATAYLQAGTDLGERLASAFERAFTLGARRPVLVGSDSPTLPGHLLAVADRALERFDVVLGPAFDGGYYAIGLRKPEARLFQAINWTGSHVLAQTIDRARQLDLSVFYLPQWHDVDTVTDITILRSTLQPGSATARALADLEVSP